MTYAFIRMSSLGDVVLTTAFARALRHHRPGARIVALTRPAYADVFANLPGVETWTVGAGGSHAGVSEAAAALRTLNPEIVFDLHGKAESRAIAAGSGARVATVSKRVLARRAAAWMGVRDFAPPSTGQRCLDALGAIDVSVRFGPDDPREGVFGTRWQLASRNASAVEGWMRNARRWIGLAPGAGRATKRWPERQFQALARVLSDRGAGLVAVGSADEGGMCARVTAGLPRVLNLAGRPLALAAAALAKCSAVVTGDSGFLHVSEAVGTTVVALFGPTAGDFGFRPYLPESKVVELALPCRPCDLHGPKRCPLGHLGCLEWISPAAVLRSLES